MATSDSVTALYLSILGHVPDPASLDANVAAVNAGLPLSQLALSLATSSDGVAAITAVYRSVTGRAPSAGELSVQAYALASSSLSSLGASLASEQAGVQGLYAAVLGRAASAGELASAEGALTGGQSVAALTLQLASSPEGQADIASAYQSVFGRAPTATELSIQTYSLANTSLARLTASLASEQAGIQSVYGAELGRTPSSAELSAAEGAITGGQSIAAFTSQLAASPEAQTAVINLYQTIDSRAPTAAELSIQSYALATSSLSGLAASLRSEQAGIRALYAAALGRGPTPAELTSAEIAITSGQSVASFTAQLATPSINASYIAELGRDATPAELAAAQGVLAGGGTVTALRGQIAAAPEAQADIAVIYSQILGRAPTASELAASATVLAQGGTLEAAAYNAPGTALLLLANGSPALLPATRSTVAYTNSVAAQLINGSEAVADIDAAFQNAVERAPNAVELAAAQSELNSGVTINQIRTEIDELAGGFEPQYIGNVQITPQVLAGSPGTFVYSTLNDDAIISANPSLTELAEYGSSVVTGFNPATDALQLQSEQAIVPPSTGASGASTTVVSGALVSTDANGSTVSLYGFGNTIDLTSVPQLTPANIPVVASQGSASAKQEAVVNAYQTILGRPPSSTELASGLTALTTGTQSKLQAALTAELTGIDTLYAAALGRTPTPAELSSSEAQFAAGAPILADLRNVQHQTLAYAVAQSPEAQADITSVFMNLFGFAPTNNDLFLSQTFLSEGFSLYAATNNDQGQIRLPNGAAAVLPPYPSVGPVYSSLVNFALIPGASLSHPFNYHGLNGVEQAAAQSLLFSGIPSTLVEQTASGLADNFASLPANPFATITPQTVGGVVGSYGNTPDAVPVYSTLPTFIYGLFNNDALVSSNPRLADTLDFNGTGGAALVTGFNPATDVLEYQPSEGANGPVTAGSAVIGGALLTPSGSSTVVQLTNGPTITLAGVTLSQLSAPNFQVIASTSTP